MDDRAHLDLAKAEARLGLTESGIPIGAALVLDDGTVLGEHPTFLAAEELPRARGVDVVVMNDPDCVAMMSDLHRRPAQALDRGHRRPRPDLLRGPFGSAGHSLDRNKREMFTKRKRDTVRRNQRTRARSEGSWTAAASHGC